MLTTVLALGGSSFWLVWPLGAVIAQQKGWSALAAGVFAASTWLSCLAFLPFAHVLVDRYGHRWVILLSTLVLGVACAGYAFAFHGWLAWLWAVLLGASFGLRWPVLDAWALELTPKAKHGRVLAMLETVAGITLVAGPAMAASIGLANMRALTAAAAGMALASILLTTLIPTPAKSSEPIDGGAVDGGSALPVVCLAVLMAAVSGGLFESGFIAAGPLIAAANGMSAETGLWISVLVGAGSIGAQLVLGWGADRLGALRLLTACAAGLAIALAALVVLPGALVVLSAVIGGLGGGLYTLATIHSVQTNGSKTAGAIGITASAYTLGSIGSPALAGATIDSVGAIGAVTGMAAISGIVFLSLGWRLRAQGGP